MIMYQSKMLIIQFKITSNRRHKYAERSFIITCNIQISMNHSIINPQEIERSKGKVSVPLLKKITRWSGTKFTITIHNIISRSNPVKQTRRTKWRKTWEPHRQFQQSFNVRCQKVVVPHSLVQSNVQCRAYGLDYHQFIMPCPWQPAAVYSSRQREAVSF